VSYGVVLVRVRPSSRRSSSYLHGFCATIPHRGELFLVKRWPLARRLSAPMPLFVAPTSLRHLTRLRPHPRFDLHPRRARYGFPSPVTSYRPCPTITHAKFAVQPLSDRAPSSIARLPRTLSESSSPSSPSSSRSSLAPSAPDPRPQTVATIAIHVVIDVLSIVLCYLYAAPLLWRVHPAPLHCLFLP